MARSAWGGKVDTTRGPAFLQPLFFWLGVKRGWKGRTDSLAEYYQIIYPPWKWMVGRWISFWDGLFSGAMLVWGRVLVCLLIKHLRKKQVLLTEKPKDHPSRPIISNPSHIPKKQIAPVGKRCILISGNTRGFAPQKMFFFFSTSQNPFFRNHVYLEQNSRSNRFVRTYHFEHPNIDQPPRHLIFFGGPLGRPPRCKTS